LQNVKRAIICFGGSPQISHMRSNRSFKDSAAETRAVNTRMLKALKKVASGKAVRNLAVVIAEAEHAQAHSKNAEHAKAKARIPVEMMIKCDAEGRMHCAVCKKKFATLQGVRVHYSLKHQS
jgi:hypothetical protein